MCSLIPGAGAGQGAVLAKDDVIDSPHNPDADGRGCTHHIARCRQFIAPL